MRPEHVNGDDPAVGDVCPALAFWFSDHDRRHAFLAEASAVVGEVYECWDQSQLSSGKWNEEAPELAIRYQIPVKYVVETFMHLLMSRVMFQSSREFIAAQLLLGHQRVRSQN